jgi:hypothetical protein
MRYALVITISLGSTLLAQAEPIDRGKWAQQTGIASKSCLAKFRQNFHEATGHSLSNWMVSRRAAAVKRPGTGTTTGIIMPIMPTAAVKRPGTGTTTGITMPKMRQT